MDKPMKLPELPPVPLAPMGKEDKKSLVAILRSVPSGELWRLEVQEWVRQGYARIWIHLCLERGIQPPMAANRTHRAYKTLEPLMCAAAERVAHHTAKQVEDWHLPEIALAASALWREAMGARATATGKREKLLEEVG